MITLRRIAVFWIMAFLLLTSLAGADSMRCGSTFIEKGERTYLVLQKCGEPVSRQEVGYTINQSQRRELVIEEWIYGPRDGNYYYIITFVGGRVSEIVSERP